MSVYHLNHLKCPMVDEGMKKNQEKWGLPRIWEEPSGFLGFPFALTLSLNHSHSLPSFFSLTQRETGAMLQGHQDGLHLAMRSRVLLNRNGPYLHVPQSYNYNSKTNKQTNKQKT